MNEFKTSLSYDSSKPIDEVKVEDEVKGFYFDNDSDIDIDSDLE